MRKNSTKKKGATSHKPISHEPSSGNVFADGGLPEEYLAKAALVSQIDAIISTRQLTQSQAAELMGIDQPRVSALLRGKLDLFSLEKLIVFIKALGNDVEISVKPSRKPHLSVTVARPARARLP